MPFRNLNSFVSFLERHNDLVRVQIEVDPHLEITEIATRIGREKGPALLFENVKGSKFPILINTLATSQRVKWALGRNPEEVCEDLVRLSDQLMPPRLSSFWKERSTLGRLIQMRKKSVNTPPVYQNKIDPADLDQLPVAQSWPLDGGPFFTFPLVHTKSPVDQKQNMGVYRMHKYNKNQTGMHWQISKGGGYHYLQAEELNQALPLAVAVGADPILMLSGILPLPEGLDESVFAGFLRGEATRTVTLKESQLVVPAEADFILEGFVPPKERRVEGPYGDHFGHYSQEAPFPIFNVNRIWHRDNPIFPISVVGKPPQEDQVIGDAVQLILLPLLKKIHPEIIDCWAYQEAGFHNLLVISVKERFKREAIKTALWSLGEGQLALTKCVILVGPNVNARNFRAVLKEIRKNFDPKEDFILLPQTSQDTLDFTSFKMNLGSKMILNALPGPHHDRGPVSIMASDLRQIDSRIIDSVDLEGTMLILKVKDSGREILEKMIKFKPLERYAMVTCVSPDISLNDQVNLIWGIFTRFDCYRDTFFMKAIIKNGHPVYEGPLFIDATWKKGYPKPLSMTDEIIDKVDRRWDEYKISFKNKISSPNQKLKELTHTY